MKRKNHMERMLSQFIYNHKQIDSHIVKAGKSAEELSKFLSGKKPKPNKEEEK